MLFIIPGGLVNTDGVPISVALGPDWMSATIAVAAALVFITLIAMLVRGDRNRRRRRLPGHAMKKLLRRARRVVPAPGVWMAVHRNGPA